MVLAGTRWLGIRLDFLSALLIGAVALFAAFYSHNNGKEMFCITLFKFLGIVCSFKTRKTPYVIYSVVAKNGRLDSF